MQPGKPERGPDRASETRDIHRNTAGWARGGSSHESRTRTLALRLGPGGRWDRGVVLLALRARLIVDRRRALGGAPGQP